MSQDLIFPLEVSKIYVRSSFKNSMRKLTIVCFFICKLNQDFMFKFVFVCLNISLMPNSMVGYSTKYSIKMIVTKYPFLLIKKNDRLFSLGDKPMIKKEWLTML